MRYEGGSSEPTLLVLRYPRTRSERTKVETHTLRTLSSTVGTQICLSLSAKPSIHFSTKTNRIFMITKMYDKIRILSGN